MYTNLMKTIKAEKSLSIKEVMEKVLDKLQVVCKEKKRRRVDPSKQQEDEDN
jgi:hypothetical protein